MSVVPSRRLLAPGALFAGTLAFYVFHLCPTTTWGDSAGLHDAIDRPLGMGARDYPLFLMLERMVRGFPTDDFFINANLLTAFLGALTVVMLYGVIRRLTWSPAAAVCGAISFGIAHTVWTYAVITEVYTLNHLVMAGMLLLLLEFRDGKRWALPLLFLIAGLGAAHHRLLGFMALPVLLFVGIHGRRLSPRLVAACTVSFLVGATPLLVLAGRTLSAGMAPGDLVGHYLTGGVSKSLFNTDPATFARGSGLYGAYLVFNFIGPAILLVPVGAVSLFRRDRAVFAVLGVTFLAYAIFAIGYRHHGIWIAYNTHSFLPVAVLVGLGAAACLCRFPGRRAVSITALLMVTAAVPYVTYRSLPTVLDRLQIRPFRAADARGFHRWFLDPSKRGDTSALDTARAILGAVPDDAVVVGDWGVMAPLRLIRRREAYPEGIRLDLHGDEPYDDRLDRLGTARPVFLAHFPYFAPVLKTTRYELAPGPGDADLPLRRILPRSTER